MVNSFTIKGLTTVRTELASQIDDMKFRLQNLEVDLTHVDKTLRILGVDNPELSVKPKKLSVTGLFMANELPRLIIAEFRQSEKPLTAREIATSIIRIKGWSKSDKRLVTAMTNKVGAVLNRWRRKDVVAYERQGKAFYWRLV